MTVRVSVPRYNPAADEETVTSVHEVPWKEYMTVLQALHYINEYIEPVAFDYSCRGGLCGRCGMMVNGEPCLACFTVMEDGEYYELEPLEGMPVIRDLVVDKTSVQDALVEANAEVVYDGDIDIDELPELDYDFWWEDLHRKNMCRECGLCFVACPVYQADPSAYAGPAALSQVYLRAYDGLDQADRIAQAVELGVFNCTLCGACDKVCPSYIDHTDCNRTLQEAAREAGLAPADDEGGAE